MAPWAGDSSCCAICDNTRHRCWRSSCSAAAHAIDCMRPLRSTPALEAVHAAMRRRVPFDPKDHRLDRDIAALARFRRRASCAVSPVPPPEEPSATLPRTGAQNAGGDVNMSVYIDSQSRLHHDQEANLALTCPHCQVVAHITALAVPSFDTARSTVRRTRAGVSLRLLQRAGVPHASRSNLRREPRRAHAAVRRARARAREVHLHHLPEEVEVLFKEALTVFSAGSLQRLRLDVPAHGADGVRRSGRGRQAAGCSTS